MHDIPTLFCVAVYTTILFGERQAGRDGKPDGAPSGSLSEAYRIGQICKLGGVFCRTPMSHASASNGLSYMKDANQNAPCNRPFTHAADENNITIIHLRKPGAECRGGAAKTTKVFGLERQTLSLDYTALTNSATATKRKYSTVDE
jgi:hypothetical protein